MVSNKKRVVALVVAAVIVLAVFIFFIGVEIDIPGVICLNNKFYPTPKDAYLNGTDTTETLRDISVIELDDHNAVYFAYLGNDQLLVAQMKVDDNTYYYMGNEELFYERVDKVKDATPATRSYPRLSSKSQYGGNIEWALVKASEAESIKKGFDKVEIGAELDGEALVLVYRIVD